MIWYLVCQAIEKCYNNCFEKTQTRFITRPLAHKPN